MHPILGSRRWIRQIEIFIGETRNKKSEHLTYSIIDEVSEEYF